MLYSNLTKTYLSLSNLLLPVVAFTVVADEWALTNDIWTSVCTW